MESDEGEETATNRRSSRIQSLNVNFNYVLARSIECIDVTKEGQSFLDNGLFLPCTGGMGSFTLGKRPLWFSNGHHIILGREGTLDSNNSFYK